MARLQNWWATWDEIHSSKCSPLFISSETYGRIYLHHEDNGFHSGAFQRSSLKLMVNYARIFVLCASLARIQKLQPANSESEMTDQNVLNLWQSLITTIMDQLAFLINWPSYRCQLPWAPTYPALTIAFVSKSGLELVAYLVQFAKLLSATFALRIARWRPKWIDQDLLLDRAERICDFLKQPPYPDVHRTVSIFVNYARALIASQRPQSNDSTEGPNVSEQGDGHVPSYRGPDSLMQNAPPLEPLDDHRYRPGTALPSDKDPSMVTMPGSDAAATTRPPLPRMPDTMEAPNWTMSNSIADSFGLFEEGQNDIFDFLPMMPSLP